ncbi:MAG TPA: hypothetical protein VKH19_05815 [Gemmatimonadaceae bacterium]|nr:hypothetical protein [Gemmatimonadaceae bacterium]
MRNRPVVSMRAVTFAAFSLMCASTADAQLPSSSPAAFALGGNFTAMARGYEAVSWNAANLAMPGRPLMSFGMIALGGNAGLAPVDLTALHRFSGQVVDSATKASWVDLARQEGGQRGEIEGAITPLALSIGPIGLQVGTTFYTHMNFSPDALEAWLFGNAGASGGQPKTVDLTGSRVRAAAFSTGALSFALPLPITLTGNMLKNEQLAVGITGKYIVGHGLIVAEDLGSSVGAGNIDFNLPVITVWSDTLVDIPTEYRDYDGKAGMGIGADLAVAWRGGPWKLGFVAENIVNTFKWDTTKLAYLPGTASYNQSASTQMDFDQHSYVQAPQLLRDIVAAQAFRPAFRLGAALQVTHSLTLTGDVKQSVGDDNAIVIGPKSLVGVGAEWRLLPFLPIRGGVASITDGWQAGAGLGVRLLGYELGVATSIRKRGVATESGLMVGVLGIGH